MHVCVMGYWAMGYDTRSDGNLKTRKQELKRKELVRAEGEWKGTEMFKIRRCTLTKFC